MDKFILSVTSRKLTQAGAPRSFTVGAQDFLVGSAPDCDFVLSSTGIEGRHLVFRPRDELLVLVPLTRRGEISLNSRVVKHAVVLSEGDVVSVADTKIEVKVEREKKKKEVQSPHTKDDDFEEDGAAVAVDEDIRIDERKSVWPKLIAVLFVLFFFGYFIFSHFYVAEVEVISTAPLESSPEQVKTLVPDLVSEPVEEKDAKISVVLLLEEALPDSEGTAALVMERSVNAKAQSSDAEKREPRAQLPSGRQDSAEDEIKWMSIGHATQTEDIFVAEQDEEESVVDESLVEADESLPESAPLVEGGPVPIETMLAVTDDYSRGKIARALKDIRKICRISPADKSAQRLKNKMETVSAAWVHLSRTKSPARAYLSAKKIVAAETDTSNFYRRKADSRLKTLLEKPDVLAEECRQTGLMLQAEGKHEEALENFRVARSLNPEDRMSEERIRTLELILKNRRSSLYKAGYVLEPGDKAQAEKIWDRL